jgi:hypothetical protein
MFLCETAPSDLHSQVKHVCHKHDNLKQELSSTHNKIARLSQGINIPIPTTMCTRAANSSRPDWHCWGCPWRSTSFRSWSLSCPPDLTFFHGEGADRACCFSSPHQVPIVLPPAGTACLFYFLAQGEGMSSLPCTNLLHPPL